MLLLGSSVPVRIMTSASCCHLTSHCCRFFSLNLACWPPWKLLFFCRRGREHWHCTQSWLRYVSLQVLYHFPTETLLQAFDHGWESYQLYQLYMYSKLSVWASRGSSSSPCMCAQQWVCGHPTVLQELALAGSTAMLLAGRHTVQRGRLLTFLPLGPFN